MKKSAIIYIPADQPNVGPLAQQGLERCERRGYRFHAMFRHWAHVDRALGVGEADVVVLPSTAEHRAGCPAPDTDTTQQIPNRARQEATVRLPGQGETPQERRRRLNEYLDAASLRMRNERRTPKYRPLRVIRDEAS